MKFVGASHRSRVAGRRIVSMLLRHEDSYVFLSGSKRQSSIKLMIKSTVIVLFVQFKLVFHAHEAGTLGIEPSTALFVNPLLPSWCLVQGFSI